MFYGSNVWDPVLIIAQIVAVQCLFYVSLGLIQAVTLGPTLGYITVAYIFDWGTLHFSSRLGVMNWISHVVNAIAGAAALAWVVERAKKCLDFGSTCYLWHTIFVVWYSGWPASLAWWLATGVGMAVMVLLGEWFCVRREMQDIPLSIPQRLGSGLLSRGRKESGQVSVPMMALPTDDPDQPPRPRLRAGLSNLQRSSAAAAAAAAAAGAAASATAAVGSSSSFTTSPGPSGGPVVVGSSSSSSSAASPGQLPPAGARPGSVVQLVQLSPLSQGAAGSAAAAAGSSSSSSSASGAAAPSGGLGQGGGGVPAGSASRKKLLVRPASQNSLGGPKLQAALAGGAAAAGSGSGAVNGVAGSATAAAAAGAVEPL